MTVKARPASTRFATTDLKPQPCDHGRRHRRARSCATPETALPANPLSQTHRPAPPRKAAKASWYPPHHHYTDRRKQSTHCSTKTSAHTYAHIYIHPPHAPPSPIAFSPPTGPRAHHRHALRRLRQPHGNQISPRLRLPHGGTRHLHRTPGQQAKVASLGTRWWLHPSLRTHTHTHTHP